ncbi:hypothetical protein [Streptomyces sp. NPDC090083]|uniref:hypothetical protein n=1 Tax=Streptomyces sp. NPDC090083 TaxID=3365941 RepID=UPI00382EF113
MTRSPAFASKVAEANTGLAAIQLCPATGVRLDDLVATAARDAAPAVPRGAPVAADMIRVDRAGTVAGRTAVRPPAAAHHPRHQPVQTTGVKAAVQQSLSSRL